VTKLSRLLLACFALAWALALTTSTIVSGSGPTEAPTGFDGLTNGNLSQAEFDAARLTFEERDDITKGLGPVYNAQSCAECHQTPVTGGISQVSELRAGHFDGTNFIPQVGGSLVNDRAVAPEIQETVLPGNEVRTFRTSLNTLGDGFVEAIDDQTLIDISNNQPAGMRGEVIHVPILEGPAGSNRVGRFGWKNQMGSLLSFASDAYLNEQGITNRFNLVENTSNGLFVAKAPYDLIPNDATIACTIVADGFCGEDPDEDIEKFAAFMRATKAPSRGAITGNVNAGSAHFNAIGCNTCHVGTITTAPAGTPRTGMDPVPDALGNKIIHPFGDFLLHNIGTGDGIVQNGPPTTRNKMRTAPLWGVRTRSRLMHDGQSLTFLEAILRHAGEALPVTQRFTSQLNDTQRSQLLAFLGSL
jgi:CxxC motif-containing protein (DUF1111 family)